MRFRAIAFVGALSVLTAASGAFAATYMVAPDSTGDYVNIQTAINAAAEGDTIMLTNGTFTGPGNWSLQVIDKGITILSQSGDPTQCIIECLDPAKASHWGIYFGVGVKGESTLEGVTIQNGSHIGGGGIGCYQTSPTIRNCRIIDCEAEQGAGIYVYEGSPVITGCHILGNTASGIGGGILAQMNSSPLIEDCLVRNNRAESWDGDLLEDGDRDDRQVIFAGAGICCKDTSSATITGCEIVDNEVSIPDVPVLQGVSGFGGGVACLGMSNALIEDCTIKGNRVEYSSFGPLRYLDTLAGGGVYTVDSMPTIRNCRIYRNTVVSMNLEETTDGDSKQSRGGVLGGGVAVFGGAPTFENCAIMANTADLGGGVFVKPPPVLRDKGDPIITFDGCTVCENAAAYQGGGFFVEPGYVSVLHCTISSNLAGDAGGFYFGYGEVKDSATMTQRLGRDFIGSERDALAEEWLTMDHSILWGNCAYYAWGTNEGGFGWSVLFTCCDINAAECWYEVPTWGDGNIFTDPRHCCEWDCEGIVDKNQDGSWPWYDRVMHPANYNLNAASPCVEQIDATCGQIGSRGIGCSGYRRVCVDRTDPMDGLVDDLGGGRPRMGVEELDTFAGSALELMPATPNPFNPSTELMFAIPAGSEAARVTMIVYNALGQKIRTLVDEDNAGGLFRTVWDGRDDHGAEAASGVYFCHLRWRDESATTRLVMLK